ncbi:hypothetical protein RUND412_001621 [Rhizina undulata]
MGEKQNGFSKGLVHARFIKWETVIGSTFDKFPTRYIATSCPVASGHELSVAKRTLKEHAQCPGSRAVINVPYAGKTEASSEEHYYEVHSTDPMNLKLSGPRW